MGAEVIAVARGADKLEAAKAAGAHHLLDALSADIRAEVKALGGADVVYDAVGGDMFKDAMRATNPEGRILVIGFASGEMPQIAPNHLLVKNIDVIGFYWGGYMRFGADRLTDSLGADGDVRRRAHHAAYRRDPAPFGLCRGAGPAAQP
jgi:NADPH2:quinone reductase